MKQRHGRTTCGGFTLIEILVVVSVIMILAALAVSFGSAIMSSGQVEKTKADIALLMTAINNFHDARLEDPENAGTFGHFWPDVYFDKVDSTGIPSDTDDYRAWCGQEHSDGSSWPWLYDDVLKKQPDSLRVIASMDADSVEGRIFRDAFGNPLVYLRNKGLGGKTPLLVSPGPDGKINFSDDNHADNEDNITSAH